MDDHSRWDTYEGDDELSDMWARHLEDACRAMEAREAIAGRGLLPMFAERMIGRLRESSGGLATDTERLHTGGDRRLFFHAAGQEI